MLELSGTGKEIQQILSGVCSHTDIDGNCVCDENCIQCKEGCIQAYGVELKITKPKRWKPKEGEEYFTVQYNFNKGKYTVLFHVQGERDNDPFNTKSEYIYKDIDDAEEACRVLSILEENKMTRDELDEWIADDGRKHIYCIKHGIGSNTIQIDYARSILEANTDYFKDKEIAQKVINECGQEALKKYYFKVVD